MKRNLLCNAAIVALYLALLTPGLLFAQPGGPPRGPGGPGGFGGPGGALGGGLLGLVQREDVQQELQLIDEQRDKVDDVIADARQRIGDEMRDMFAEMRDLSDEERQARFGEIRTRFEKFSQEADADLKKVLLPHQIERLKQIDVQQRIQQQGANALTAGDLADALNLTDDQRDKLEQRANEVRQELQEKIAKLRLEARDKMLDVLTSEQRAKLDSLMGDAFAMPDAGGPGGFQGRGGRGGIFGGGERERERGQGPGNRGRGDRQRPDDGTN
ncbi:MAG: hypothetical protein WD468_11490 [Pirellulales bacterium]